MTQYENLYRVVENQYYAGGDVFPVAVTPSALAMKIKEEYPEIKKATRLTERWYTVRQEEKIFNEGFTLVDPDFLSMFSIDLLKGDKATALLNPQSIILTEELADKYFGNLDPVGRTLSIDKKGFMVTGVMKNFPLNSHINVKSIIPFVYLKSTGSNMEEWGNNSYWTYVLLAPNTDLTAFNNKIKDLIKRFNKGAVSDIYLQHIGEIHLYSAGKFTAEIGAQGDIRYVRALSHGGNIYPAYCLHQFYESFYSTVSPASQGSRHAESDRCKPEKTDPAVSGRIHHFGVHCLYCCHYCC